MNTYERVAKMLAGFDGVQWEPMSIHARDIYMVRAASVVAVIYAASPVPEMVEDDSAYIVEWRLT